MNVRVSWLVIGALLLTAARPDAHHRLSMFRQDKSQVLDGTIVELIVQNPHSLVVVDVADGQGAVRRWVVEWVSALQLKHDGVTSQTLKPGDHLIITGYPAQDPQTYRLWLRTISRPTDGWSWTGTFQ